MCLRDLLACCPVLLVISALACGPAAAEPPSSAAGAEADASLGCMMKSMMCSSWKGLSQSQVDQAKEKCTADAGQALAECPVEGRVATCAGATSPSGNPMPDVHFYGGGAAPDPEGVLTVAEKICSQNGGTLSK